MNNAGGNSNRPQTTPASHHAVNKDRQTSDQQRTYMNRVNTP
jgi:hypothetical protein